MGCVDGVVWIEHGQGVWMGCVDRGGVHSPQHPSEMAIEAGGTHPSGMLALMHSCISFNQ